jgi:hypothetical protein
MSWKLAAAAVTLRDQVNKRYPKRDRASDGTIGDKAHRRRISDHNPDKTGYVMALDLDEDDWPATRRVRHADQLRNVVYRASGTYSNKLWVWRSAPRLGHAHHIHISFAEPAKHDGAPFPLPVLDGGPLVPAKKTVAKKTPAKKAPAKKTAKKATPKP